MKKAQNRAGYDTSSDGGGKATAGTIKQDSSDDMLLRANTEQIQLSDSGLTPDSREGNSLFGFSKKSNFTGIQKLAWRDFFEGEELDRAY